MMNDFHPRTVFVGSTSRWRRVFGLLLFSVLFAGCPENSPISPPVDPWPSDFGDGGWNGGGGGNDSDSGTSSVKDTAGDTEAPSDTEDTSDSSGECPTGQGDRTLELDDMYEVPLWLTGQDTVFNDLFPSPGDRLYLFNDQQYCEIIMGGGGPDFSPESGSFCSLTPELSLRGWTLHQGSHFVVDNQSRTIFSGFVSQEERLSFPLPSQLKNPTGLASDGQAFWVSDGSENLLWRVDTAGKDPRDRPSLGVEPASLSVADSLLFVLHGYDVSVQTFDGEACYTLGVPVLLSGFALGRGGQYAYGVAKQSAVVYRFKL